MTLTSTSLAHTTLLAVDSKPLFRDMVRSAFLTKVRGVREATCIDKAMEILGRGGIGCVLCDWDMMPVGGLELLRMIRAGAVAGTSPRTPVIILTSRPSAEAVKTAVELDVNGFVVSPVALENLIGTVTTALSRTWMLQQPSHYAQVRGMVPKPAPFEKVGIEKVPLDKVPMVKVAASKIDVRRTPPSVLGKAYGRRADAGNGATRALRNVRMCILDDVSPGVVLARDLRDRDGYVLAPSGTELKPAVLERLRNVGYAMADSYCVWVGER